MAEETAENETESGPESTEEEEVEIRNRMCRRVRDRRLKEWLDGCDPELTVLCILIAQNQFFETEPYQYLGGGLARLYFEDPHRLLAEANIPEEKWEIWKQGDWEEFEEYFESDGQSGLPAERGLP